MVDFLVIGPYASISYGNFFHLIKDRSVRLGFTRRGMYFDDIYINSCWFQNLIDYCPPPLVLSRKYVEGEYKMIDNFDAINISKTEFIPQDYDGVMAVPVSFLEFWNPHQFYMIGLLSDNKGDGVYVFNGVETKTDERHKRSKCGVMDGKRMFNRLLIRRK